MQKEVLNIAIIEDDPTILEVLTSFLDNQEGFKVILSCNSVESYIKSWQSQTIHVLLSDIGLPGKNGIEATIYTKKKMPTTHVILQTVFEDSEKIFQAFCAGASGYLLKSNSLSEIKKGILDVIDGGASISPKISLKVLDFFKRQPIETTQTNYQLTGRELEILSLIESGKSNKVVSEELYISIDTVKYHIKNIYNKLEVNSRPALIAKYKHIYDL